MDNLLSYCGLVETKVRASDNYLPVYCSPDPTTNSETTDPEFSRIFKPVPYVVLTKNNNK